MGHPSERLMEALGEWLQRQYRHSAHAILQSVSATSIIHMRAGFGQHMTPVKGSVVASPVPGAYDPNPDYFYHWFRDSALVLDALRLLHLRADSGLATLPKYFSDFVDFSLLLERLDGRALTRSRGWRDRIEASHLPFVRCDADLEPVHGEQVAIEARVNPDGSLDISRWARPQFDGPALRALCVLRWLRDVSLDEKTTLRAQTLLRHDLALTLQHWATPCFDIWEEELGLHYYTVRVSAAALELGARWLGARGDATAEDCERAARAACAKLELYWNQADGYLKSRILSDGSASPKALDISVLLAGLHASNGDDLTPDGPRLLATMDKLETLFAAEYAINRERPAGHGVAMGRYKGDVYFSGGAFFFSTLGAAQLCYLSAQNAPDPRELMARGDAFLETVRQFTPGTGAMSEQFDQNTGLPSSAPKLAWSYAALIASVAAREAVIRRDA